MLSGKPLFPGRDYHHQLTLILDVLGTPTLDEFYAITTRRSRDYIRALPFRKRRPFAQLFPNASALACDFLTKTLTFDPKKRLTVEQALAHPYLEAYVCPLFSSFRLLSHKLTLALSMTPMMSPWRRLLTLISSSSIVSLLIIHIRLDRSSHFGTVHKDDISREQLKELLYEEIMSFRPAPMV
jgi:mitogen-activated protein kinase 1/3